MPSAATDGMIAGIYNGWIAKRDSNGYPKGTAADPDAPTAGQVLSPHRFSFPISFTPPAPSRRLATRVGGQTVRGQRDLGLSSLGTFQIGLDSFDETFHALVAGSVVDVSTVDGWAITSPNVQKASLPKFVMGISVGYLTANGANEYITLIFHNVQIGPALFSGSQGDGENPNPLTYEVVPDLSARTGIGRLYSTMTGIAEGNSDIATMNRASREIALATFIRNGTATSFTLPFRPTSSLATGVAGNSITNNGVTQSVASVNTATGLVTLTTAGTSGDVVVIAYPTEWVAV